MAAERPQTITAADLADRHDFTIGEVVISPSTRSAAGPGGSQDIEPRVMQVLVALADASGQVVSRETLFARCWGDVTVGDDSLNRAIAGVRRIASEIGAGSFVVETIPRTGYRLKAEIISAPAVSDASPSADDRFGMSRRGLASAAAGVTVLVVGAGYWWRLRNREEQFDRLMKEGQDALDAADGSDRAERAFQGAVELEPDNAEAQGKLAYALTSKINRVNARSSGSAEIDLASKVAQAAQASLAINPRDLYARLAKIELDQANLDMAETDARLTELLAEAPSNTDVLRGLWSLRQSAGLSRDALALVTRAIAVKPLAAGNNYPFGQLLWITGQNSAADRVLERAITYWPDHRFVRFARFNLLAYTGRSGLAEAMINDPSTRPQVFGPPSVALWRIALKALTDPTPANVASATTASLKAVVNAPQLIPQAVLSMAKLGEVDAAFEIANQLLQFDSPVAQSRAKSSSVAWRFAPWLFTPPAQSMQRDPRFAEICDATGLSVYWAKRGVQPDFLRRPA